MTIASISDTSGEGTHNEYEFEGGLSNWFNTETWAHAWDISNSQSLGQALSLAVGTKDILDKDEVDKWEGTSMHRLASGTTDALFTIVFVYFYLFCFHLFRLCSCVSLVFLLSFVCCLYFFFFFFKETNI